MSGIRTELRGIAFADVSMNARVSRLSDSAHRLWIWALVHAGSCGTAYLRPRDLARAVWPEPRTEDEARRALDELRECGLIECVHGPGRSHRERVLRQEAG